MENMDKALTVPKWVLIFQSKILQVPQNLSARFVCPSSKVLDFNGKNAQETHCTKMGAESSAENTPYAPKFICPICLPKPKTSGFQ